MELDGDALAGVCDLFGGLTDGELARAVEELAARRGESFERDSHEEAVADARGAYVLVAVEHAAGDLLAPGPVAFPVVPEGGEDLPHILDVPRRDVPMEAVETALRGRLARDVAALSDPPEPGRVATLVDVTYDAAAATGADFADVRERIEEYQ